MTGSRTDRRPGRSRTGSHGIVVAASRTVRPVMLAILLLPATLAAQDPGKIPLLRGQIGVDPEPGSLLATPARLTVGGLPLSRALARLTERSRVQIAFSPTLLPARHPVDCDCAALNTARALDQLLAGTNLGYVELGSQVLVVPRAEPQMPGVDGDIRGRVRTLETLAGIVRLCTHPGPPQAAGSGNGAPCWWIRPCGSLPPGPRAGGDVAVDAGCRSR